jgi:hypothetical protein
VSVVEPDPTGALHAKLDQMSAALIRLTERLNRLEATTQADFKGIVGDITLLKAGLQRVLPHVSSAEPHGDHAFRDDRSSGRGHLRARQLLPT